MRRERADSMREFANSVRSTHHPLFGCLAYVIGLNARAQSIRTSAALHASRQR